MNVWGSKARTPLPLLARCGECGLWEKCLSPKMKLSGRGGKKLLILAEAPGLQEDEQGKPLVGRSGQFLEEVLGRLGIEMRQDCWLYNSVICRPKGNILPPKAVDHCRPNVIREVRELKPEKILLLGASAVKSLIGWLWKEDAGGINRWVGWRIPNQRLNSWIMATWHPAHLLREEKKPNYQLLLDLFTKHIRRLLKPIGRPWSAVPDYKKEIEVICSDYQATKAIEQFIRHKLPTAFDFETDRLKPDSKKANIVSCSLSNGSRTISFPWQGKVIEAVEGFLISDVPKIGWNAKYESRWVRGVVGVRVKNWIWDGMLVAHQLDNRPQVTGLKFQAFARLGAESYDDELKPYMQAPNGNTQNRLKEVSLEKLLLYGGYDSLFTWQLAQLQMEELGYE